MTLFWCFSNEPHVQFGLLCFCHMRNRSEDNETMRSEAGEKKNLTEFGKNLGKIVWIDLV